MIAALCRIGNIDLTANWVDIASLLIFVAAYALVITEEYTHAQVEARHGSMAQLQCQRSLS